MLGATALKPPKLSDIPIITQQPALTWEEFQAQYPKLLRSSLVHLVKTDEPNRIAVITETSLKPPEQIRAIPPAKDDRRTAQERFEAAERAEALSVALSHPHRAGSDDPRLATSLGRFCAGLKLGDHCRQAGERYREIIEDEKRARGFEVHGWAPSDRGYFGLTEAQIEARKELAIRRRREADEIARAVHPRAPWVLEKLVYEQLEPSLYDGGVIINVLVNLADEWKISPQRFGG